MAIRLFGPTGIVTGTQRDMQPIEQFRVRFRKRLLLLRGSRSVQQRIDFGRLPGKESEQMRDGPACLRHSPVLFLLMPPTTGQCLDLCHTLRSIGHAYDQPPFFTWPNPNRSRRHPHPLISHSAAVSSDSRCLFFSSEQTSMRGSINHGAHFQPIHVRRQVLPGWLP